MIQVFYQALTLLPLDTRYILFLLYIRINLISCFIDFWSGCQGTPYLTNFYQLLFVNIEKVDYIFVHLKGVFSILNRG